VIMGGNCGIADHVTIQDDVIVAARGGFAPGKRVKAGIYWGAPALPLSEAKRMMSEQRRLGKLREKVEAMAKRLEKLEARE
jgi:UDP-3-O-[3-hydroxymyristoyl] glucosamine N-acyltransferase